MIFAVIRLANWSACADGYPYGRHRGCGGPGSLLRARCASGRGTFQGVAKASFGSVSVCVSDGFDILRAISLWLLRKRRKDGDSYGAHAMSCAVASVGSCFVERSDSTDSPQ